MAKVACFSIRFLLFVSFVVDSNFLSVSHLKGSNWPKYATYMAQVEVG